MKLRPLDNPPSPYESTHVEWLEPPPVARLQVFTDDSQSILSKNDSPDLPFTWSVNPYRGCQHACAYCYARRTHEYLGFGAGTDFETKIVVKPQAAKLLRKSFESRKWKGESVNFSGVTDCYQPLEASYGITRECLEICLEFSNPATVVTKGCLVARDADLLAKLSAVARSRVWISIPFADAESCALIEPQAPHPLRRIETIRRLTEAGVPTGVMVAPIIPGLNDRDIPWILQHAAQAGASSACFTALRLPGNVREVFIKRLAEVMPLRANKILNRQRDTHGGELNRSAFGERMRGDGPYWEAIKSLFEVSRLRYGLSGARDASAMTDEHLSHHPPPTQPTDPQLLLGF